ncbi:hypothetical protein N7532_007862 [Penicillium argentinense]|uniref:5'-3' DNA helicase ZGRF1-like N-terminal domain-containing protein n=1 Tax=Penicillium argentinense TaxID=1131581 RepID=A0A9W9EW85_9EURO|nr:uncharacterized protein N7532_007862 [Penicillium argentinense]KAJ5089178.1 hypothetical protein N7532_007862 [Penicillium argentinense]
MSVPSSAPRVTAPTSSQTPVTASVVKFRCLFTHDLRRKSKRWQDGYLRYHAFNKRVMVYDEHGNYIGDHHWRAAEEVQDGDELELDKGVLIEVGERMSTTQQDLTNLFEKKRSSQASPGTPSHYRDSQPSQPPRPTPTPVRATGGSSQSFRSLNDLLGIKRTPIGHLVSPYEERHPPPTPSLPGSSARPPKRPRVSAENPRTAPPSPPAREVVRRQQDTRPNPPITPLEKPKPKPKETPRIPNPPSNPASTLAKPSLPLPSETRPRPPNSTAHTAREDASVEPSKHRDLPNNDISRPSRPNNDQEPPKKPGNVLRMAKEKPRRKLMYNALLPTSSSSDGFQKSSSVSSMGPPMGPPSKRSHPASNPSPKKSESVHARNI